LWGGHLFGSADALEVSNSGHLSIFVMMTCLNGYFQGIVLDSLAEALVKSEKGGAVAVWASSAMTYPEHQALMNREFYRQIYSGQTTLGEAVAGAKAATADLDARRSWILFGDPTTRIK